MHSCLRLCVERKEVQIKSQVPQGWCYCQKTSNFCHQYKKIFQWETDIILAHHRTCSTTQYSSLLNLWRVSIQGLLLSSQSFFAQIKTFLKETLAVDYVDLFPNSISIYKCFQGLVLQDSSRIQIAFSSTQSLSWTYLIVSTFINPSHAFIFTTSSLTRSFRYCD
jgi:hypothetical protein